MPNVLDSKSLNLLRSSLSCGICAVGSEFDALEFVVGVDIFLEMSSFCKY